MPKPLIGILGGTFDPLHNGHLQTVKDVRQALSLSSVHLIPNAQPPHRQSPLLAAEQRLSLVSKALQPESGLIADDSEVHRGGISYMCDTLTALKKTHAEQHLCLIIGMDAYNNFCSWYQWPQILETAHLIVMRRAGVDAKSEHPLTARVIADQQQLFLVEAGLVYFQQVSQLEISSTLIRQRVKANEDIQNLVPELIRQDIQTLYKG